ncbi:hypothetical protein A1D24_07660 [Testudinibacter aquarius]|nr:hypothetical protein A1D24_07660 [Testudinibacter aquarius]
MQLQHQKFVLIYNNLANQKMNWHKSWEFPCKQLENGGIDLIFGIVRTPQIKYAEHFQQNRKFYWSIYAAT